MYARGIGLVQPGGHGHDYISRRAVVAVEFAGHSATIVITFGRRADFSRPDDTAVAIETASDIS